MKKEYLNRREALKIMSVASGMLLSAHSVFADENNLLSRPASHKKARIVIAGGGTAGIIAAARARRSAPNAQIVLISPNELHLYQSGQLFVAAGLEKEQKYLRKSVDLLPENVTWLKEKVISFDPKHNTLKTEKSGEVFYDILIVALGGEYDYSAIEGLSADMIGKKEIASVYLNDTIKGTARGAKSTNAVFDKMLHSAKFAKKPLRVLFTEPNTPVKGAGTSLSLLFLYNSFLKKIFANKNVHFTFVTADTKLLSLKSFDEVLRKEVNKHKNIDIVYEHDIIAIDSDKKRAYFKNRDEKKEFEYDYIHIVPPLKAVKAIRESSLAILKGSQKGWMEVDEKTLRHKIYENVFGIGDIVGLGDKKSGAAAQHQGIILQDNIAAALEGDKLKYSYDGYTASPIVTSYGKVLLAEYNEKKPLATFILNPYESRRIWWYLQRYFMPWAYFNLLMRGMM